MANSAMFSRPSSIPPAASSFAKNGRGVVRDKVQTDFRAAATDFAGAIEHVLMRERYAVQRTKRIALP